MLGQALLIAVMSLTGPQPAPFGEVTATIGHVLIRRGEQTFTAAPRSGLLAGDRLITSSGGAAIAYVYEGRSIYFGAATTVDFQEESRDIALGLQRGELRITSESQRALTVVSGRAKARIGRSILRASAGDKGTRLWTEFGTAEVVTENGTPLELTADRETFVPVVGTTSSPTRASGQGWEIRVDELQLVVAAETSRRHKRSATPIRSRSLDAGPFLQARPPSSARSGPPSGGPSSSSAS